MSYFVGSNLKPYGHHPSFIHFVLASNETIEFTIYLQNSSVASQKTKHKCRIFYKEGIYLKN